MCVICHVRHPGSEHRAKKFGPLYIQIYIGGWKNITYRGRRGEGHPSPYVMIWIKNTAGFGMDMKRVRPYLKPERTSNGLLWGHFTFAWKFTS